MQRNEKNCRKMHRNVKKFWEMLRNAEKCREMLRNAEIPTRASDKANNRNGRKNYLVIKNSTVWFSKGAEGQSTAEPLEVILQIVFLFFLQIIYLHSWQKAASLLIQHLYSPPFSLHLLAKPSFLRRSQSFAQTVASSEELRTWQVL